MFLRIEIKAFPVFLFLPESADRSDLRKNPKIQYKSEVLVYFNTFFNFFVAFFKKLKHPSGTSFNELKLKFLRKIDLNL